MKSYLTFHIGVFVIGGIVGLLTGLSASPVVAVLIPLIFGLITAGGAVYVIRGAETAGATVTKEELRERARILGVQLIAFSLGFVLCLWPGVAAKLHPEKVWFLKEKVKPAYSEFKFEDLRILAAVIELDQKMKSSGLDYESRRLVVRNLHEAMQSRAIAEKSNVAKSDIEAAKEILGAPASTSPASESPKIPPSVAEEDFERLKETLRELGFDIERINA